MRYIQTSAGPWQHRLPLRGLWIFGALICQLQYGTVAAEPFILTAAPIESAQTSHLLYLPIATYLSKATGRQFVYKKPADWVSYMRDMRRDVYDLIFDGPHFISWRTRYLHHTPLARLPGAVDFVVVARRDNQRVAQLHDLAGYPVCSKAPPELSTLLLQSQFDDPHRQPVIALMAGAKGAYSWLLSRRCDAAVLSVNHYTDNGAKGVTRILFQSEPLPKPGFSASLRISAHLQRQITDALLESGSNTATTLLRRYYSDGAPLVPGNRDDYDGIYRLLDDTWGFDQ